MCRVKFVEVEMKKIFGIILSVLAISSNANDAEIASLMRKAEAGDPIAQNQLGDLYYFGRGIPQDYNKASSWFLKSANQGNAEAQYNIGYCYLNGQGVDKNIDRGVAWYRQSANQNYSVAQNALGECYEKGIGVVVDYNEAVLLFRKSAEQGLADAQINLASCYRGGRGVPEDVIEGLLWDFRAALQGDGCAQDIMGRYYELGIAVKANPAEAIRWYRKSADNGFNDGIYRLARCYDLGIGVAVDKSEATKWYRKAAEAGSEDAKREIDKIESLLGCKKIIPQEDFDAIFNSDLSYFNLGKNRLGCDSLNVQIAFPKLLKVERDTTGHDKSLKCVKDWPELGVRLFMSVTVHNIGNKQLENLKESFKHLSEHQLKKATSQSGGGTFIDGRIERSNGNLYTQVDSYAEEYGFMTYKRIVSMPAYGGKSLTIAYCITSKSGKAPRDDFEALKPLFDRCLKECSLVH